MFEHQVYIPFPSANAVFCNKNQIKEAESACIPQPENGLHLHGYRRKDQQHPPQNKVWDDNQQHFRSEYIHAKGLVIIVFLKSNL